MRVEEAAKARLWKYKGTDKSPLFKHVLGPYADYLVQNWTPRWMACVRWRPSLPLSPYRSRVVGRTRAQAELGPWERGGGRPGR
jgi:hypothetical protein